MMTKVPIQPSPGFVIQRDDVIAGVKVWVMATTGYQSALVKTVYPFQGLYDAHLMAQDFSLPDEHPRIVLPDVVTRHYGECRIICDTEDLVSRYREFFKDAVRVVVRSWEEEHLRTTMHLAQRAPGDEPLPPPLETPGEVLCTLAEMNVALYEAHRARAHQGLEHIFRMRTTWKRDD